MRRRTYLSASLGVLAGLAGCLDDIGPPDERVSPPEPLGPTETVEAFYDAIIAGDPEEANEYLHPVGQLPEFTESRVEQIDETDPSYRNATVVERTDDSATVSIEITTEEETGAVTAERIYELHRFEGEWLLYDSRPGGDGDRSVP